MCELSHVSRPRAVILLLLAAQANDPVRSRRSVFYVLIFNGHLCVLGCIPQGDPVTGDGWSVSVLRRVMASRLEDAALAGGYAPEPLDHARTNRGKWPGSIKVTQLQGSEDIAEPMQNWARGDG